IRQYGGEDGFGGIGAKIGRWRSDFFGVKSPVAIGEMYEFDVWRQLPQARHRVGVGELSDNVPAPIVGDVKAMLLANIGVARFSGADALAHIMPEPFVNLCNLLLCHRLTSPVRPAPPRNWR